MEDTGEQKSKGTSNKILIVDIPASKYLTPASHSKKLRQFFCSLYRVLPSNLLPQHRHTVELTASQCGGGSRHGIIQAGATKVQYWNTGKVKIGVFQEKEERQ